MAVWIVRAGEKNRYASAFLAHGVIAVGWEVIPYDWGALSSAQILETLLDAGANPEKADMYLDEILDFRDRMAVGDLVVTPDPPAVLIGEITGPDRYRLDSPIDEYRQVRTVSWLGSWPRDQLPEALYRETARRDAINRQQEHAEAWLDLGRRLRAGQGPTAGPGRAAGPSRTPKAATTRPKRQTASAPKAVRPKVAAPAQLLCPSCHCRLPATRFAPGAEICTDCE
jgi:predicted Mrr-cat superfamily restriction endonuclease